MVHNLYIP